MISEREAGWDEFVEGHSGGDLVQTVAWAETKRAIGQQSELTVLRSGNRITGGAMLVTRRVAPGISVGYSARGPLAAESAASDVIDATIRSARDLGVWLLMMQAAPGDDAMDKALASKGFEVGCPAVAPEATIRLDLSKSEDELLASMSETRRRNIRKALRSELVVREDADVAVFQGLHAATAKRQGFTAIGAEVMGAQWRALAPNGHCRILLAYYAGKSVAGIWLTYFAGVVTFRYAGWDAASEGSRNANEALHWEAIRWARSVGAHSYDLGGFDRSAAETLQSGGTLDAAFARTPSHFKLGFGGTPILLPRARWCYLGPAGTLAKLPIRWALRSGRVERLAGRLRNG